MPRSAEERVLSCLREALVGTDYRLYPNVRWIAKPGANAPARDGETDLLIVHPERGLLIVETKGGPISRDNANRWWSGGHELKPPPFTQAETSKHNLKAKITSLPDWPGTADDLRAGHAVAFPDVSVRNPRGKSVNLGTDAPSELVIDQGDLASAEQAAKAVERAYDYWLGDGRRGSPLTRHQLSLIDEMISPTTEVPSLLRHEVAQGEREVISLVPAQLHVLNLLRGQRRASIVGPAGSGKTVLAMEKARRLAAEGFSTLLVCFNQPLARMLADELADAPAPGGLHVSTFHELCLTLAREAGTLPPEPAVKQSDWFDEALPRALEEALPAVGGRYHAIVIDEGQDFDRWWLDLLYVMLTDPEHDVLYVFHDPEQSLYQADVVAGLGLNEYPIEVNCRNPGPIHALAARYSKGLEAALVLREGGRAPEVIAAAPGGETLEALRVVLHRLTVEEGLAPWQICVLTGRSLARSDVWRQRRFGNQVLWNGAYDDEGHHRGMSAAHIPEQPTDTILFDSIRRFKGLEREVVVLVELDQSAEKMQQLMYVGATRARQHLVVIGG
jgi:hypothetical protein